MSPTLQTIAQHLKEQGHTIDPQSHTIIFITTKNNKSHLIYTKNNHLIIETTTTQTLQPKTHQTTIDLNNPNSIQQLEQLINQQ